jgi:hypothetical protein
LNPSRALAPLVIAALALPIAVCVLVGVARLLTAMQDAAGGLVVDRIALAAGILWIVVLICLVIVLSIVALIRDREPPAE